MGCSDDIVYWIQDFLCLCWFSRWTKYGAITIALRSQTSTVADVSVRHIPLVRYLETTPLRCAFMYVYIYIYHIAPSSNKLTNINIYIYIYIHILHMCMCMCIYMLPPPPQGPTFWLPLQWMFCPSRTGRNDLSTRTRTK